MKNTHSRSGFGKWLPLLALALVFPVTAPAATLFSTLGQSYDGVAGMFTSADRLATDFQTGASATTITGASLNLANDGNTISLHFLASLFTDSAGLPGTSLGSFSTITLLPSNQIPADYSATSAGISLSANTKYWLVLKLLEDPDGLSGDWSYNQSNSTDAGSVFTPVSATQIKYSNNNGSTWVDEVGGATANYRYSLTGTTTAPEPGRALLLLAGTCGMVLRRKRTV